jgi:transposase-like protein
VFELLKEFEVVQTAGKYCPKGHLLTVREAKSRPDGYELRCSCKSHKTIRENSFFYDTKIRIWQVLYILYNFAFEFMNYRASDTLVRVGKETVSLYKKRIRAIILESFKRHEQKIGGIGKTVEVDESLFCRVKHNRGHDMRRKQVWVFGLYERPVYAIGTGNKRVGVMQPKVLFIQVAQRDAVTLLNAIYQHVEPGTVIHSDCWGAYNEIIRLDKQYAHRTVNHSMHFVGPDGTHTNSIESMWRAAKVQFKQMGGVLRVYLQAYLDEYCWRFNNGNKNGWQILKALLKVISDFFKRHQHEDANNIVDQSIAEYDNIANTSDGDVYIDDYCFLKREERGELPLGNIADLKVPQPKVYFICFGHFLKARLK